MIKRIIAPEATGRATAKLKYNVEVNPLVVKEYQENNFLQWKWTSTAIHSSMPFISSPISRSSVYGPWAGYYEQIFLDLGQAPDLVDDNYGPAKCGNRKKPAQVKHFAGATMLLFYLWLPGFHLNLSLYMSELAETLDPQTRRSRDWYDNPDHFYVSPGGIDTRSGVGSDLGSAERPMTMDSFELTHFPLELILIDGG